MREITKKGSKDMEERIVGTVKMFDANRGFGFITRDDAQDDVYFHFSAVEENSHPLLKGDRVEFSVEMAERGPRASAVERLEDSPPSDSGV